MWRAGRFTLCRPWQRRCMSSNRLSHHGDVGVSVGQELSGFRVLRVSEVPEFALTAVELQHQQTKAHCLHVARADPNNVFGVGFPTIPQDSTGVSHILEHTALCGSSRYPCRDPFFKMLTRSLSTFMNAFTASDFTMYPFSTTNKVDYYNLLSVYLDAALRPNLRRLDFLQEGWRLEHEDPKDPTTPIIFKGVVFNEMKGALSSNDTLFYTRCQQALYPTTTYAHVSGGDPAAIPSLSWEQLRAFHAEHYHPSNAFFYSYGDLPVQEHLTFLHEQYLAGTPAIDTRHLQVPLEKRWSAWSTATATAPADPMAADLARQVRFSLSFLLHDTTDPYEGLVFRILQALLVDGQQSPFFESLIKSGLGTDFSPNTGYSADTREASFSVGLQGVLPEDVPAVQEAIMATFHQVVQQGFAAEHIESILHQIELSQKHQKSNFGLNVAMGLYSHWLHGADPIAFLRVNEMIERFRADLQRDPDFLQKKLQHAILQNTHCLAFSMYPDAEYNAKLELQEQEQLNTRVAALTSDDKAQIVRDGLALLQEQDKKDDQAACLPTLHVTDIERRGVYYSSDKWAWNCSGQPHVPIVQYTQVQPTNDVNYFRASIDLSHVSADLRPYIGLFAHLLCDMGTEKMSYTELAHAKRMLTGTLTADAGLRQNPTSGDVFNRTLELSSTCLTRNVQGMFDLWYDVLTSLTLNPDHLKTLINVMASDQASSVSSSGHQFAMSLAASCISPVAAASEQLGGLDQVQRLQTLARASDLGPIIETLSRLQQQLFCGNAIRQNISACFHLLECTTRGRVALNCDEHSQPVVAASLEAFLARLPGSPSAATVAEAPFTPFSRKTYVTVPFAVNYAAQSVPTVPFTHVDSAPLSILSNVMTLKYLHREIREKGGAYGGGASHGSSLFKFYSYRDPSPLQSVKAFQAAVAWAAAGDFSNADVAEAKLSVFQSVDAPVAPGARGLSEFSQDITIDMKQSKREQLLDTTREDLVRVACNYLVNASARSIAVLGEAGNAPRDDVRKDWEMRIYE